MGVKYVAKCAVQGPRVEMIESLGDLMEVSVRFDLYEPNAHRLSSTPLLCIPVTEEGKGYTRKGSSSTGMEFQKEKSKGWQIMKSIK